MLGSLTLDMKVLGLGRQGHEVTGGVDSSPEAAQPSPRGGGGEVRLGNCALQQMVQVLSNLVVCVCWEGRQRGGFSRFVPGHPQSPASSLAVPWQGQSFAGYTKQLWG